MDQIVLYGGSRGLVVDIPGGGGVGAGGRVMQKRESPYFRFPEVDLSTPHTIHIS